MQHSSFSRLLLTLVLLVGATLCAVADTLPAKVNDGQPVQLVVDGLPQLTDAYNVGAKADMAVARAFMDRYPNVTLKPFSFVKVPGAGDAAIASDTNTLMAMAAGIAPDVFTTNFRQSDTFIRQGFLLPLDTYFEEWRKAPGGAEEVERVFSIPVLREVAQRKGPDNREHLYAIPPNTLAMVMMYRKDLLRAAGLDPEKPPKTWDEFYNLCLQVSDPRKDIWGYSLQGSWFLSWMMWSMGNDVLVPTENGTDWIAAYDDEKAVEAYKFAWKLVNGPWAICPTCDKHYAIKASATSKTPVTCPDGHTFAVKDLEAKKLFYHGVCSTNYNLFSQGKMACMINYMGDMVLNLPGVDPSLIQLARVPAAPTGMSKAEINAQMYAIKGTLQMPRDRGKIEAAWAYIRFQCSDEAKRIKTKTFVEAGYAKYLNPAWLRKFGYEAYLREVPPSWEQTFRQAMQDGRPEPYGKNAQQIYSEMDIAWGQVRLLSTPDNKAIGRILHTNVQRTNERLMGIVPSKVKKMRDRTALIVVSVSFLLFVLLMRYTMSVYGTSMDTGQQRSRAAIRQLLVAWMVMLPALAAVLVFQYLPLARGSLIAFQDYQIILGGKWVGLANFGQVLYSREFWVALTHSLQFAALSLGLGFFAPLILALLLHEIPHGSLFYRIVYFLPSVTSGVVVMLLWIQLYDPSPYGMLNQLLGIFHVAPQQFLQDPNTALFWVVLPGVWMAMGPGCIIYLAALRQIPTDYYEAADMDGAGVFAKLRMITLPFMKPLLIINFVGACVGSMKSFEPILIMTGGGPAGATRVLGMELWQNSFMYLRYGYATAMGWILASLLIGFTMFQLRYLSKVQFRLAKSE